MRGFEQQVSATRERYPFLEETTARRLVRAYGTLVSAVLEDAKSQTDLGRMFGADLSETELRYLARVEWAMTAEDVVWRRSKLGLRLSRAEIAEIDAFLKLAQASPQAAE